MGLLSCRQLLQLLIAYTVVITCHCEKERRFQNGNFNDKSIISTAIGIQEGKYCRDDTDCPLWAYCNDSYCRCPENLEKSTGVRCDDNTLQLSVHRGSCMTYNNLTKKITEGKCIESCGNTFNKEYVYLALPYNLSELNQFMCEEKWNRTGQLCGKCLPGHAPLAYSYDMRCVHCPEGNKNIWKYILLAFGPLTLFYFIILFFKINATSSHLHGYLYFSQTIAAPITVRYSLLSLQTKNQRIGFNILIAFYSVWTLDILKSLHPDICLNVSTLTIFAMDYALALYPLLLTVVSYILIELHDRNYRVIVFLWKPFRYVFTLFRRNWSIRTTVIDAYATFFRLSFVKVLYTSADILTPTAATDLMSGNTTWMLYYNGTMDYFGAEHLPYAILAIVLCTVLTIAPTLLFLLYPFRWFQRMLICLKLQGSLLRTVMDSFQGCYKDGTESGTRDCRWFAGVPLIVRLLVLSLCLFTKDASISPWTTVIAVIGLLVTIAIQPYKHNVAFYTKIDATFIGMLVIFLALIDSNTINNLLQQESLLAVNNVLLVLSAVAPLFYMVGITLYWILSRMRGGTRFYSYLRARIMGYDRIVTHTGDTCSLPDRLLHPEQYTSHSLRDPVSNSFSANNQEVDTY